MNAPIQKPTVEPVDPVEQPNPPEERAFSGAERVPSNWDITPDCEKISAQCTTGRQFFGTVEEFNNLLNPNR